MSVAADPHVRERTLAVGRRVDELSQQLHDTDRKRIHQELAAAERDLVELNVVDAKERQNALRDTVAAGESYELEQKNVLAAQTAFVESVERASALRAEYLKNWRRANKLGASPLPTIIPALSQRAQQERGDLLKLMRRLGAAVSTDV